MSKSNRGTINARLGIPCRFLAAIFAFVAWQLAAPSAWGATPALVQSANVDAGTTTSASLAFPAANAAGNFIAVCVRGGASAEYFSVTDSRGNTYRTAVQLSITVDTPSGDTLGVFYAPNVT